MQKPAEEMIDGFFELQKRHADAAVIARFAGKTPMPQDVFQIPAAAPDDGSTARFLAKARLVLPLLRHLPGVRAIAVANSVALGTADSDSDIDLLIVTAPQRLWIARVCCTALLHVMKTRRHGNKIAGRFCLSFFVSETALDFERIALFPRDPYLAFWIASLVPVFGRRVFAKLAQQNQRFVSGQAGISIAYSGNLAAIPEGESGIRLLLETLVGARLERFLKNRLLPRALAKKERLNDASGTIISDEMLKFHDRDARAFFALNLQ